MWPVFFNTILTAGYGQGPLRQGDWRPVIFVAQNASILMISYNFA